MRLLPYVRVSVLDDASTSPERQIEKIENYARLGDHELAPITERDYDLNVSGSLSPFERPGLGRWLRDDRLCMWDGICVAKLDRLTRSLFDFVNLLSWLEARTKTLVCLDPVIDLSNPAGRAFASVAMSFAQFERDTIAARVRDVGWGYEPDPVYGPIVAQMCDRYMRCGSLAGITRWLNETCIPTPWNVTRIRNGKPVKNTMWKTPSVRKILASPAILGAVVKTDGTPVRDDQGVVIYRANALITRDVYERIQARLAANPVNAKVNTWMLTQIVFCALCKAPMYGSTARYASKTYTYYCCVHSLQRDGKCAARRIKAAPLEAVMSSELLRLVGDAELTETKLISGSRHSEDIVRVASQIGRLFSEIQVEALSGYDIRGKQETLKRAQEELARLHALNPMEARKEPLRTGQTFRQRWESLDAQGRNDFLRAVNVRATVEPSLSGADPLRVRIDPGKLAGLSVRA